MRAAAAAILLVTALACDSGEEGREGTAATSSSATDAPALEAPPESCEASAPESKPPGFPAPVYGRAPVWMGLYGDTRSGALLLPPDTPYTEHGWRIKVLWLLTARQKNEVTVRAQRIDRGPSALIEVAGSGGPRDEVVLDPANPPAYSNPRTADFPSSVYFSDAGCYAFEASWPGGRWRAIVPVGR
jgi:hypothetical protein